MEYVCGKQYKLNKNKRVIIIKLTFPPVGMRTVKTLIAIFIVLAAGELLNMGIPIYAIFAAVLTMRDTVANSVSFGIARLISIFIGGSIGIAYLALGVKALSPLLSVPLLCVGAFVALYATLVIKNPNATAYALLMFFIVYYGSGDTGDVYGIELRRIVETVVGVVIAVLVNKLINFKSAE